MTRYSPLCSARFSLQDSRYEFFFVPERYPSASTHFYVFQALLLLLFSATLLSNLSLGYKTEPYYPLPTRLFSQHIPFLPLHVCTLHSLSHHIALSISLVSPPIPAPLSFLYLRSLTHLSQSSEGPALLLLAIFVRVSLKSGPSCLV